MKLLNVFPAAAMLLIVLVSGCKKDDDPGIRPVVNATDPISKSSNIAISSNITATFNVSMDPSTITEAHFTLKQGTATIAGAVEYSGMTASFNPGANLSATTLYTATITTGVKSATGNNMTKDYVWDFTTASIPDVALPTVASTNPGNTDVEVTLDHSLTATFSEPMDQTTINASTFMLKHGNTSVAAEITYTGSTATLNPEVDLDPKKLYTLTITTGAKDKAGNAIAAIKTVNFTTADAVDIILPRVNSTAPLNNAINVATNKIIAVTFSEEMDPLTINEFTFILKQGTLPLTGTIEYSGTTATFTPVPALVGGGTTYTATITPGAQDRAHNALADSTEWTFTTGSSLTLARVELGTAGNYVILAETAINNSPTSKVTGDLGLSPYATSFVTGFALTDATGYATSSQITGKVFAANMAAPTPDNLTTAVENMITAYDDAAGRPSPDFTELFTGNIGGQKLSPGLYKWTNSVSMTSDVTISGDGTDIWIFQIAGDLTMSAGVKITLIGGAQAKNIFWQVAGQATLGTTTHFEGIILSKTGITFQTGGSMNGRALAQTAVILDKNTITKPQ
jgi:hypothetical protein